MLLFPFRVVIQVLFLNKFKFFISRFKENIQSLPIQIAHAHTHGIYIYIKCKFLELGK